MRKYLVALLLVSGASCERGIPALRVRYSDGSPASQAEVAIDSTSIGLTGDDGTIDAGVTSGIHTLSVMRSMSECSSTRYAEAVDLSSPVVVVLPRPVQQVRALEVTSTSVHLAWDQADADGFREYRVYASLQEAFDEKTGLLVHVSLDRAVTEKVIQHGLLIQPNRPIYFRVYVLNSENTLAGSCLLGVTPPRWNSTAFPVNYQLVEERNFAAADNIVGVAWDGAKLWLLLFTPVGEYRDPDDLSLIQLDPVTRVVERVFEFHDFATPRGLTWDGQALWLSYPDEHSGLYRFDLAANTLTRQFGTEYGTQDLGWDGTNLLLNRTGPEIYKVDPVTGGIVERVANPFVIYQSLVNVGIAYRPGELWLTNRFSDEAAILSETGVHIGVASAQPGTFSGVHQVAFMNDRLVLVAGPRVTIYRIEP